MIRKKFKLKKGDDVVVLTGKDKGKKGKIIKMLPKKDKAIVSDINNDLQLNVLDIVDIVNLILSGDTFETNFENQK